MYGLIEYTTKKNGAMIAISQQRMREGRPLARSLKVKYLLACRSPEERRNENMRVWMKLRKTMILKQMSCLKAPRGASVDLKRL